MRLYALIRANIVLSVMELSEDEYREKIKEYDMIIDIQDMSPQPKINWIMIGNQLVPPTALGTEEAITAVLERAVDFGCALKKEMSVKIGTRNLMLGRTEQEITSLVSTITTIGLLLEGGALKTARTLIMGFKANAPEYSAECDYAIDKINAIVS